MDGQRQHPLVLGGYDREKVIGPNFPQRLDYSEARGCWTGMMATVVNLQVNFRNGSAVSMMPPNLQVPSCIVPQRQLLWEGPADIVWDFQGVTGSPDAGSMPLNGLHALGRKINMTTVRSV